MIPKTIRTPILTQSEGIWTAKSERPVGTYQIRVHTGEGLTELEARRNLLADILESYRYDLSVCVADLAWREKLLNVGRVKESVVSSWRKLAEGLRRDVAELESMKDSLV